MFGYRVKRVRIGIRQITPHLRIDGSRLKTLAVVALCAVALGACTMTKAYESAPDEKNVNVLRIMLLPPDIEISELSAGGLLTPKAAWTSAAERYVNGALNTALDKHDITIVRYQPPASDDPLLQDYLQMEKLHAAVGQSIVLHKYFQPWKLPTKGDNLDWTLGPNVNLLAQGSGADHVLFVHLRDSFSSDGRVAAMIFAALLGVSVQGGVQVGFASLVDLESGEVVWFNRLFSQTGDLREAEGATAAVNSLLTEAPL